MNENINIAIFDYIKEQYTETELSSYDRDQIIMGVYEGINDYIEQFVN